MNDRVFEIILKVVGTAVLAAIGILMIVIVVAAINDIIRTEFI